MRQWKVFLTVVCVSVFVTKAGGRPIFTALAGVFHVIALIPSTTRSAPRDNEIMVDATVKAQYDYYPSPELVEAASSATCAGGLV